MAKVDIPLIEGTDIDLRKDFDKILDTLEEFKSNNLFVNEGKEIHFAVLCRKSPSPKYQEQSVDYYAGKVGKKLLHCYKMKV